MYEEHENTKTIISKDEYYGEKITLNNYLNTVEFNIDDYESTCKNYTDNSLSIELKATNENGDIITYEIPLRLNDNCISTASWVNSTISLFYFIYYFVIVGLGVRKNEK